METPQVRPGLVKEREKMRRVVVFFPNSALGNLAIQLLMQIGIPNDKLGVTPPGTDRGRPGDGPVDRAAPMKKYWPRSKRSAALKAAGSTASAIEPEDGRHGFEESLLEILDGSSWPTAALARHRCWTGRHRDGPVWHIAGNTRLCARRAADQVGRADFPLQWQQSDRVL